MKKILLVDDMEIVTKNTIELLSMDEYWVDYQFDSAKNKEEAINYLENQRDGLELITLDLGIPTIPDSLEVLKKIKKERFPTRILIVTAWASSNVMAELSQFQIQDILLKPLDFDEYLNRIKVAISQPKLLC